MIFSSRVPRVMRRYTLTTFFWPMRWARSIAWRSLIGFQSCSMKITVSAPVRFRPSPPTWVVRRRTSMDGSALNFWTIPCRRDASVLPSRRMYDTVGMCRLNRSRSMMSSIVFSWQNISTRCCETVSTPARSPPPSPPAATTPMPHA
ncbi:MAG: hypothetical protein BJ554DRAFT_7420 [Olpidium bornovanus]|uniref:Uncharacterized protein n=1 Tax=Olpidium bornovanus TaxID=278681 RepID=A0A8H8DJG0_9FUNG|nr:MAG: hypothetical protein BJ554DRAFT_7420 [Olpidium bornovanus]